MFINKISWFNLAARAGILVLLSAVFSLAQTATGIKGRIMDDSSAIIPGVTVQAQNSTTQLIKETTTNEQGEYEILTLVPGTYQVNAKSDGFQEVIIANISVAANQVTTLDIKLSVGSTSDIVEVNSSSQQFSSSQIQSLPINRRNFIDSTLTSPGQRDRSNNFTIDGVDNNDATARNTEQYTNYGINPMTETKKDHLSTFGIDVDTASYTIARRKLSEGELPPADSVRVEEFINYFQYRYPAPATEHPFSLTMEAAPSPFTPQRYILRIGLQGKEIVPTQRPNAHLTFLVDTSGSMMEPDKIELVKRSLKLMIKHLQPNDTVAITTYAGDVRLVLPPTKVAFRDTILTAIEDLTADGATAMEAGIQLAYQQAHASFESKCINRIIICSDGDANIGNTGPEDILKTIEGYVQEGITVSTMGFGMGNYKDTMMEQFADKGNGNYYYIDTYNQAKRVFVEQLAGTLQVIAQDVKIQVEFNPLSVKRYRLIGYENRDIADEDFRNDAVDSGELGAGHRVTAIYELELQNHLATNLATVRLRYKQPNHKHALELANIFASNRLTKQFNQASEDLRFAVAVTYFAEILRNSPEAASWTFSQILDIAQQANSQNLVERKEFATLVQQAQKLKSLTLSVVKQPE